MPNDIALFKGYVPLLDEVYKLASLTAALDGNPELARLGANAGELIIPKLEMQGLGHYNRNSGYADGEITLRHMTVPVNFDRGRMFTVDNMDNAETAGIAFGQLAGEFIRTKVAPELEAFRFATYATTPGIGAATPANLASGEAVLTALRAAANRMDQNETPEEDRHLFITHELFALAEDLDLSKSKAVLARFASITRVPQTRFYTAIDQLDGTSEGEQAGGYAKAAGAKNINFMVLHKGALIQFPKHIAPKVIAPEQNQTADAWKFGYRQVGVVDVYENKVAGIYLHAATV